MAAFMIRADYRQLQCSECGVVYFYSERWCVERGQDKRSWGCPNGHSQVFCEGEIDRLRRERDLLKQDAARLEEEKAAAERETQRLRRRIGRGVCPCCNRTFTNIARHIKTKHPNIVPLKKSA